MNRTGKVARHPEGCASCPAELPAAGRDINGDPLCQSCPHRRPLPWWRAGGGDRALWLAVQVVLRQAGIGAPGDAR
jgi:hypothetical protein